MRYKVEANRYSWCLFDYKDPANPAPLLWVTLSFPDAEALVRSQAAFLNESPATKEAA